jgi:hypothetical protein
MSPKKTNTELLVEYVELSKKFDFPSEIEAVFEQDYVTNHHLYDENSWNRVAALLLIEPSASAMAAVRIAKGQAISSNGACGSLLVALEIQ